MTEHSTPTDAVSTVLAFNEAINARDLAALAGLMTDTHRFIDTAGDITEGKRACVEAWRGFFDAFADYRNNFETAAEEEPGVVSVRGRSACSVPALDGPAVWRAVVRGGRIEEWQVSETASTDP